MPFSHPPTPPDHQSQAGSRRSTKMHDNPESGAHGMGREIRESRDARDTHPGDYPRTPPTEWKSFAQCRALNPSQMDRDSVSDQTQRREEEDDYDEDYWASVRTLYENIPGCSRPRLVSTPAALCPGLPSWSPVAGASPSSPLRVEWGSPSQLPASPPQTSHLRSQEGPRPRLSSSPVLSCSLSAPSWDAS